MASSTENVKLGVCSAIYDGKNMGYTKGGVEARVSTTTKEITVDQFGNTPIGEIITGRMVSATVPMAETTLENLVTMMPGAELITNGAKATSTITLLTAAPANGDKVTIAGYTFTFRTTPTVVGDVQLVSGAAPASTTGSAANLAAAINATELGYVATVAAAVITLTAKATGTGWNNAVSAAFATPANCTVTQLTGGTDATSARVVVKTGTNINLLTVAKELILRPRGTFGEDDFIIHAAAAPGALEFTYSHENERVFTAEFKGYALSDDRMFTVGRKA